MILHRVTTAEYWLRKWKVCVGRTPLWLLFPLALITARETFHYQLCSEGVFVSRYEPPTPENSNRTKIRKSFRIPSAAFYAPKGNCRLPFILISSTLDLYLTGRSFNNHQSTLGLASSSENQFLQFAAVYRRKNQINMQIEFAVHFLFGNSNALRATTIRASRSFSRL